MTFGSTSSEQAGDRPARTSARPLWWLLATVAAAGIFLLMGSGSASADSDTTPQPDAPPSSVTQGLVDRLNPVLDTATSTAAPVAQEVASMAQPVVQTVAEATAPVGKAVAPVVEQVVQPVVKPVVRPVVRPVVEKIVKPVVRPIIGPVVEDVVKPVRDATTTPPEPTPAPPTDPTVDPVTQPVADTASGSSSGPKSADPVDENSTGSRAKNPHQARVVPGPAVPAAATRADTDTQFQDTSLDRSDPAGDRQARGGLPFDQTPTTPGSASAQGQGTGAPSPYATNDFPGSLDGPDSGPRLAPRDQTVPVSVALRPGTTPG